MARQSEVSISPALKQAVLYSLAPSKKSVLRFRSMGTSIRQVIYDTDRSRYQMASEERPHDLDAKLSHSFIRMIAIRGVRCT